MTDLQDQACQARLAVLNSCGFGFGHGPQEAAQREFSTVRFHSAHATTACLFTASGKVQPPPGGRTLRGMRGWVTGVLVCPDPDGSTWGARRRGTQRGAGPWVE